MQHVIIQLHLLQQAVEIGHVLWDDKHWKHPKPSKLSNTQTRQARRFDPGHWLPIEYALGLRPGPRITPEPLWFRGCQKL